ncbi:LuxR C-terminal-related transcriptional regulator [Acetobacterium wieringae]|uniref:LuxR C-terminal-related transcriptional regulator n=1 Tax=Acetobacterium wieringae TaxID=52694 RepID=UPI0026EA7F42|nr:LuxR C-terminal-related transcriptional regulator [Acetobacterium wieringae]
MKLKLLKRQRLNQLLKDVYDYPLTIVEAPMGYGKTTAVRLFLETEKVLPVWMTFHRESELSENDWEKLAREVSKVDEKTGAALLQLGFPANATQMEQIVAVISQFTCNQKRIVVLDDYHWVNSERLNRLIELIVYEQIENLHLLLITRNTVHFNCSELVAKGLCRHITREFLKFSPAEIGDYCRLLSADILSDDLEKICSYGGGWITLTYMLLLGLERGMPIGFSLTIEDLIEQTLFSDYEPTIQQFLVELSIMDGFSGEQARFVTGFNKAEITLRKLVRENSFIAYDESRKQYVIHAVLLDFLRKKQDFQEIRRKQLYQSLGEWFLGQLEFQTGYRFLYQAGETVRILEHLNRPQNIRNELGEFEGSSNMFEALPHGLLYQYPIAYLQYIMVDLLRGNEQRAIMACQRLDELEAYYQVLEDTKYRNRILAEISIIRKFTVFNYIEESTVINDRIIHLLDGEQSYIMHRENEFTFGSPHLLYMYFRDSGKLKYTTELIVSKFPVYPKYADGCGTGSEYLALAEYALETGDWEKAALNSEKAFFKAATKDQYSVILCAKFVQIRLKLRNGEIQEALECYYQLEEKILARNNPIYNTTLDLCKGYLYAILGQPTKIPYWLQIGDMNEGELFYQGIAFNYLVYGKAVVAAGDFIKLEMLAETFVEYFSIYHNQLGLIHNGIFKAIASFKLEGVDVGQQVLKQTLVNAEMDGIILPFLENAENLLPILAALRKKEPENPFIQKISDESEAYLCNLKTQSILRVELTEREQEVLSLAAEGCKREEIAERLFISSGTVKTHLQNVYKKLEVRGKHAAIKTAERNGLLRHAKGAISIPKKADI